MNKKAIAGGLAATAFFCGAGAGAQNEMEILQSCAADYAADITLDKAKTFGVRIGDAFYTVAVSPGEGETKGAWSVASGAPQTPTYYFTLENADYLTKLDRGEFNALTLMAKAFSSDATPMDVEMQEGFAPDASFVGEVLSTTFHFWTRGKPEVIAFGPEATRFSHGTNVGVFYYQPGFRSGWFHVEPGHHVNEDERSRTNPFPTLMIVVEGSMTARIDGVDSAFGAGAAMLIPAGVSHEFLNFGDKTAFGFLFMFGEGA